MESTREGDRAASILDPVAGAGPLHYLAAMALIAALAIAAAVGLGRLPPPDAASQTQDAIMVDLPPVEAGSHPQGEAAPPQEAAPASTGAQAPQPTPQQPDAVAPKPPPPDTREAPQAPAPAAVLERPAKPPPPTVPAPPSAPQDAHETGAPTPAQAENADADAAETRHASAHLITLWQKALMARLEAARHGLAAPHATGIAKIAFAIDHDGRLVWERVAHGSGSAALDTAALGLVRRAAPFPLPPPGAGEPALSFIVPISFRR